VHSVAISADGEHLAAGSWDDKVYLFEHIPPTAAANGNIIACWLILIISIIVIFTNIAGYRRESKLEIEKQLRFQSRAKELKAKKETMIKDHTHWRLEK